MTIIQFLDAHFVGLCVLAVILIVYIFNKGNL